MNLYIDELKQTFQAQNTLTKKDLYDFYRQNAAKTPETDLFWYVYSLKQENIIKNLYKDTYKWVDESRPVFTPFLDEKLVKIHNLLQQFDLSDYCLWSSAWFNQFMIHQVPRSFIHVEVEKEAAESVFNALRDDGFRDVFLLLTKTDETVLERYIFEAENPVIISKIIGKAPTKKVMDERSNTPLSIPRLEKLLVDLFCDDNLLRAYKGGEEYTIFENALNTYAVNFKTLFAYAHRRKKDSALKTFLYQNFQSELEQAYL